MQRHRGPRALRRATLALVLAGAASALLAGGAAGRAEFTADCVDDPPNTFHFSYIDPCNGGGVVIQEDWGVDPPYSGTTYASESEAAAAEGQPGTVQVTVTLPTWRDLYDWPNGHGYNGWSASTSVSGAYGMASAHGGNYGLWLWPVGGRQYGPGFAEWAFTAPGTTRISKASLSYEYRNKLLAHHCVRSGLRASTTSTASFAHCKPITPPDSQRNVDIALADPAANPTSKQLYFRVEFPACADASSPSCTKTVAALDPLTTGGYARLKRVDMTLVDDDKPLVDARGTFYASDEQYDVTIDATDAGAGIKRVELEHVGEGVVGAVDAACDPTHRTDALGARICPASQTLTASLDTTSYTEGTHTFTARATDLAGNVGQATWTLVINRFTGTDPGEATGAWIFDPPVPIGQALAWAEEQGVRPIELVSQFPHGDETLSTGYFVHQGAANADIAADYQDFVYAQFETAYDEGLDNWSAYVDPALVYRIAFAPASPGGASFFSFLSQQMLRERILETTGSSRRTALSRRVAACYDPAVPWWPAFGRITTRQKTSGKYAGKRFVYQDFTYNTARLENLKCLANDPTLELDAVYYNYDKLHYLGGILQHLGFWEFGWKSNMPNAYLDTKAMDDPNERTYTIGTVHARKFKPGVKYWTIIHTEKGNADVDKGYAQAQEGHRDTRFCWLVDETFCIFADHSAYLTPLGKTASGRPDPWTHPVPSTQPWSGGTRRY